MPMEEWSTDGEELKVSFEGNKWVLPTLLEIIEPAAEEYERRLEENGWSAESTGLSLGLQEAIANAIGHGNVRITKTENSEESHREKVLKALADNPELKKKKVRVSLDISKQTICLKVRDEGIGFIPEEVADPLDPKNQMKTKGRGLFYMRTYYDSVKSSMDEDGYHVMTLIKERK